jgi:cytochrome c oxidase subunit 1
MFFTNHKDIEILYLLFGGFSGILGSAMSMFIGLELALPKINFYKVTLSCTTS